MSGNFGKSLIGRTNGNFGFFKSNEIDSNAPYISPNLERIAVGKSVYLYLLQNDVEISAQWSSSDTNVATVTNYTGGYGQIRPVEAGRVVITANSKSDSSIMAKLNVEVTTTQAVVESIQIEPIGLPLMVATSILVDLESANITKRALSVTINNEFAE